MKQQEILYNENKVVIKNEDVAHLTALTYFRMMVSPEELEVIGDEDIINVYIGGEVASIKYGDLKDKANEEISKINNIK